MTAPMKQRTEAMMVGIITLTILSLCSISLVEATSNGAGACLQTDDDVTNFKNAHGEALYPGITGDTSIQFSASKFVAGCMYTISICGPSYNGFLLASRDMMTDKPVGQFSDPSTTNSGAQLMTCGYLGSAVTHTLATAKAPMHFKWRAPIDSAADTHFYLTTVRSNMADWYRISEMFEIDETTTICPSVPDTNTCPAEGASAGTATDHDHMMDMGTMQMQMTMKFSTAWSGLNIVFPNWVLNTKTAYVGTVVVIFLMCVFYEWATTMSGRLDRYFQAKNTTPRKTIQPLAAVIANNGAASSPSSATTVVEEVPLVPTVGGYNDRQHALRTIIKVTLQFLSLFLMIVFMILDVGLCCAMMAGYAVGFYVFGRDRTAATDCH